MKKLIFSLLGLALIFGCQTVKELPPLDAEPEIFNRHAQEAREMGDYPRALAIYETLLKSDEVRQLAPGQKIAVQYEIAFMYFRLEKYEKCAKDLELILEAYKAADQASALPGWVKSLSEKLLADPKLKSKSDQVPQVSPEA